MGPIAHGCAKAFVPVCAYGRVTWNFAADGACDFLQNLCSFTGLILTRSESKGALRLLRESSEQAHLWINMPPIANDVGKYLSVPMAKTFQRFGVEQDDVGVVLEHDVNPGHAATNKTTLALFRADDFESFRDSAAELTLGDVKSGAERLFVGLSNTELGRLYPEGKWKEGAVRARC